MRDMAGSPSTFRVVSPSPPRTGRRLKCTDSSLCRIFGDVRVASAPPGRSRAPPPPCDASTQTLPADGRWEGWKPKWKSVATTGRPPAPPQQSTVTFADSLAQLLLPCLWRWVYADCFEAQQRGRIVIRDAEQMARAALAGAHALGNAAQRFVSAAARRRAADLKEAGEAARGEAAKSAKEAQKHRADADGLRRTVSVLRREIAQATAVAKMSPRGTPPKRNFLTEAEEQLADARRTALLAEVEANAQRADRAESRTWRLRMQHVCELQDVVREGVVQEFLWSSGQLWWQGAAEQNQIKGGEYCSAARRTDFILPSVDQFSAMKEKDHANFASREWEQFYKRSLQKEITKHWETRFASFQNVESARRGAMDDMQFAARRALATREDALRRELRAVTSMLAERAFVAEFEGRVRQLLCSSLECLVAQEAQVRLGTESLHGTLLGAMQAQVDMLRALGAGKAEVQALKRRCEVMRRRARDSSPANAAPTPEQNSGDVCGVQQHQVEASEPATGLAMWALQSPQASSPMLNSYSQMSEFAAALGSPQWLRRRMLTPPQPSPPPPRPGDDSSIIRASTYSSVLQLRTSPGGPPPVPPRNRRLLAERSQDAVTSSADGDPRLHQTRTTDVRSPDQTKPTPLALALCQSDRLPTQNESSELPSLATPVFSGTHAMGSGLLSGDFIPLIGQDPATPGYPAEEAAGDTHRRQTMATLDRGGGRRGSQLPGRSSMAVSESDPLATAELRRSPTPHLEARSQQRRSRRPSTALSDLLARRASQRLSVVSAPALPG
eukprot:TRINITY_DN21204_c0_g1_i1.p1 TRINITY_DN21204_c0_g1~~TRINITY_DN21204_c0_g1_i1.p1  ORF type:complete len:785 (+),score=207.01 TRINITY_DN21204_c0_g1_i1:37-2391(+)